ncbi:MAG: hypothetical protein WCY88_04875 [Spongiibacteraceae bacterium]
MKLIVRTTVFVMCFMSMGLYAAQDVISDDGREVQLNEDGSWVYKSSDRFANTKDGRRVRLKEDGSWVYTTERADVAHVAQPVAVPAAAVQLTDVIIEVASSGRNVAQKNIAHQAQMVFFLSSNTDIELNLDAANFTVTDSGGREYQVLSVEKNAGKNVDKKPLTTTDIIVRADGAPHFWSKPKWVMITLAKAVADTADDIVLTYKLADVETKKVVEL